MKRIFVFRNDDNICHAPVTVYLYVLGMICLIVWLIFSTSIVATIANRGQVKTADLGNILDTYCSDNRVYYSMISGVDYITYTGGILESIIFNGWAFCETREDNSNRWISFVLHNAQEGNCYEITPDVIERYDVPSNLPSIMGRTEMDIPSANVGFSGEFSMLGIKNGVYDLYIICCENDKNYGLVDTWYQLDKQGADVEVHPYNAQIVDQRFEINREERPKGELQGASIRDGKIDLYGWSCIEGKTCNTQAVYVEFTGSENQSSQYTAKSALRKDIVDKLNSDQYMRSGWGAQIATDELADGTYTVRILIANDGEVWSTQPYIITKEADSITLQQ